MSYLTQETRQRLEDKLAVIDRSRPLPPEILNKIREQFSLEATYNSNAIEGNSLTLKETAWVIKDGLTIKGKPLKDHLEARDHFEALNYLYDLVERHRQQTLSEVFVRNIHRLVVRETEAATAGQYRSGNVIITGAKHIPPDAAALPGAMADLIAWVRKNQNQLHPVELAALVHHRIVYIHPFFDGNGRAARLVMNLILIQHGYPLVTILKNDRKKYYQVLSLADQGKMLPLVQFIAQAVERSLNLYLKVIAPPRKADEHYLPLSQAAVMTPYSPGYLLLLINQGKLEGHKEGRNWVTSLAAVNRYIAGRQRKRKLRENLER